MCRNHKSDSVLRPYGPGCLPINSAAHKQPIAFELSWCEKNQQIEMIYQRMIDGVELSDPMQSLLASRMRMIGWAASWVEVDRSATDS